MPYVSPGDVHINAPLTNVAVAWAQQQRQFVADRVFPQVNVSKQSDIYYVWPRDEINRDEMKMRGPATESAGGTMTVSTEPYYTPVWAFHYDIPDQVRANVDSAIAPDRAATRHVQFKALLRREVEFAAKFMTTGVWTGLTTGAAAATTDEVLQWNDDSSNPIGDVRDAATGMQLLTGMRPNTLVLSQKVVDALADHPDILDRIKYGGSNNSPANVNLTALAALFDIDRVFVMGAVRNTANEGADATTAWIGGGRSALLAYAAPAASLIEPSAGYTFVWTGLNGAGRNGAVIRRFRLEPIRTDRVEIEMAFAMKAIAADLGHFFNNIVAA